MKFYSQVNPEYSWKKLGNSPYTVGGWGCFLVSIANLAQVHPSPLLDRANESGAINDQGLLYSADVAKLCGMESTGRQSTWPETHCIGVTKDLMTVGVPTHFFVLLEDGRMVDPLDKDPQPRQNKYSVYEYRTFSGVKIDTTEESPEWADKSVEQAILAGIKTDPNESLGNLKFYHLLVALDKIVDYKIKSIPKS